MAAVEDSPFTDTLSAGERLTAHEMVRDTLRHAILSSRLPAGTRLVQADIAAQLKVSTTPVREALRDLASDELIRFHPHRGAVVHELDMDELVEIYEIRKALEPLAIKLAATRITAAQLSEATALQRRMEAEADRGAWVELNREFHAVLGSAARSPRLASFVKTAQDIAALYVAHSVQVDPTRMREGNSDHRRLLAALKARDGDRAATVMLRHLDSTLQSVRVDPRAARSATPARSRLKRAVQV